MAASALRFFDNLCIRQLERDRECRRAAPAALLAFSTALHDAANLKQGDILVPLHLQTPAGPPFSYEPPPLFWKPVAS